MLGGGRTFLPPSALERGTSNYGSGQRMERLGLKLLQGQSVTVTFLGGSITWGRVGALTGLLCSAAAQPLPWVEQPSHTPSTAKPAAQQPARRPVLGPSPCTAPAPAAPGCRSRPSAAATA